MLTKRSDVRRNGGSSTHKDEIVYLPGYSPELNPAEYANNDTKHGVLTKQ